jgi:ABC-type uncharacterized transport system substrate-binding protein
MDGTNRGLPLGSRRSLVFAIVVASLSAPLGALAQRRSKVFRVGFLSPRRRPASFASDYYGAFPQRMNELGYVEGKNLLIEWRFADGEYDRLPRLAAELVQSKVDVILALGPPGAIAAQKATTAIPIVFVMSTDPVAAGLIKSLARPGGNITGLLNLGVDLGAKHLEMLVTIVPKLPRVAVLVNPANPANTVALKTVEAAAEKVRVKVLPAMAQSAREIEGAFSRMSVEGVGAVMVALDPLFIQQGHQIAEQALKHRLPSIFANREYAEAGGLMSYGQNQVEIYQRAAVYVDKILKGAKPGDLPVEQPTKLELIINARIAKALGLSIPKLLLVSAEKVVQ